MYLNISQMANILNVSPNTLRNWEKKELLFPERSNGNQRMYSKKDLYRARYIMYLNKERKIPISDIPTFLTNPVNEPLYVRTVETENKLTGLNWKKKRLKLDLSLKELSEKTQISISYLSKIENGAKNVSMDVLTKLAEFYGTNIWSYYEDSPLQNEYLDVSATQIRQKDRKSFSIDIPGVTVEKIGQSPDLKTVIMIYTIDKGVFRKKAHHHHGFEIIYVQSGSIVFNLDDVTYTLHSGDTLQFSSEKNHSWKNDSDEKTILLWTYVSPT